MTRIWYDQDVRGGLCTDYFRLRQSGTFSVFGSRFSS